MSATAPYTREVPRQRGPHGRILGTGPRTVLMLVGAIGIGLVVVGLVSALTNYMAFHAAEEQVHLGISVSGSYTDTLAADGVYRTIKEEYVSGEARTFGDSPSDFSSGDPYTGFVNFTPDLMPAEGGFIHQIGIYVFAAGDTQIRAALYEDTEGLPRLLLAQSEPLTVTDYIADEGWLWLDIGPQVIPGSTPYWLAFQASNDEAKIGWKWAPFSQEYRFRAFEWGPFPSLAGRTWGSTTARPCHQIAYTATQYALDTGYTIPVSPTMDVYTLTVRGATSGETFSVSADGQAVGNISNTPTTQDFFSDDMESGAGGWTADGFTYTITDSSHYSSPTHVWWTDDVSYGSSASLTSVPIQLPFTAHDMELWFWHSMVSEEFWDGGWVEYRIQNENGTWPAWVAVPDTALLEGAYHAVLGDHAGGMGSIPSGPHAAWTGTFTDVVRVHIPLTAAGRSIQWRWVFECDMTGGQPPQEPDGWWIDDVRVLGIVSADTDIVLSLPLSLMSDGQVTIRFQDTVTNSHADFLAIDFIEITGVLYNRPPSVTVKTPNSGEYWSGTRTIEWSGSDLNRDVVTYSVYLSTNGGGTWTTSLYQTSYSETATPATHSWTGFDTTAFGDSDDCLIRIQASDGDSSTTNQSDAAFTIDNTAPTIVDETPDNGSTITSGTPVISATLTDGTSGIDSTTIAMTIDGSQVAHTYDPGNGTASYTPGSALINASHTVTISLQDRAGNPASETWGFSVNEPPALVLLAANPGSIVADGISTATITATVQSNSGHPVADGTQVVFATTTGTLTGGAVYTTTTHSGVATALLTAPETEGTATVTARAGEVEGMTEVVLTSSRFHIHLPLVLSVYQP